MNHVFESATKESIRTAIHSMLESYGYVIRKKSIKKFERMNRNSLNGVYNLVRYQTNSKHVQNDLYLIYGLHITED